LLMLRTLPFYLRKNVLEKVPGPMLNLFLNRIQHGGDEVSTALATQIRETIESRAKSGETYTLIRQDARKPTTTTVSTPSKASTHGASPDTAGAAAVSGPATRPASPGRAPASGRPAQPASSPMDQPVIVSWRLDGGELAVESISAGDLIRLAGPEARILFPLVKFALQTGQVFRVPPDKVSKETLESLIGTLIKQAPSDVSPVLSKEERIAILEAGKGQSAKELLAALARKMQRPSKPAGTLQQVIGALSGKLGAKLPSFLSNPTQDSFKDVVQGLNPEERSAVSLLSRVARAS